MRWTDTTLSRALLIDNNKWLQLFCGMLLFFYPPSTSFFLSISAIVLSPRVYTLRHLRRKYERNYLFPFFLQLMWYSFDFFQLDYSYSRKRSALRC